MAGNPQQPDDGPPDRASSPDPFDDSAPADQQRSRSDKLIEQVKRSQVRPGQFRLSRLFVVTLLLAILLAVPKLIGMDYGRYFLSLYGIFLWLCAPFVAWAAVTFCPWIPRRHRGKTGLLLFLLFVIPVPITGIWLEGLESGLRGTAHVLAVTLWFWVPEVLCIAAVQYGVFGDWKGLRRARRHAGRPTADDSD
jgi:hypothetical protein